ncbi:MAG: SpoIIAA family protein [Planctomycetota bacterium]|jgi:universal stress protein A
MPLEFSATEGNIVVVRASGKLTDADYKLFVPHMETLLERWGRLRMLFEMDDFQGWDASGLWDEVKFHAEHRKDMKKVAVVGEKQWEKWASKLSRIFTGADVRYFDRSEHDEARAWIQAGW